MVKKIAIVNKNFGLQEELLALLEDLKDIDNDDVRCVVDIVVDIVINNDVRVINHFRSRVKAKNARNDNDNSDDGDYVEWLNVKFFK
ncbi:hypothetical protein G9A89_021765 [Geosiphon pyriformis]|nr:hypothetical protein G9A89_021765 [Geosiphon pyriformis]